MARTTEEKAADKAQGTAVYARFTAQDKADFAMVIVADARQFKAAKKMSKAYVDKKTGKTVPAKLLVAVPASDVGINDHIAKTFNCSKYAAYEAVRLLSKETGKFAVGYGGFFGSLYYLPEDAPTSTGKSNADDFAKKLASLRKK